MTTRLSVGLLLALTIVTTDAGAQAYRWVDENGNVNYAGSRDQVPEQYRSQLPAVDPPESPVKPTSGLTPDIKLRGERPRAQRVHPGDPRNSSAAGCVPLLSHLRRVQESDRHDA